MLSDQRPLPDHQRVGTAGEAGNPVRDFFGSWYDILGYRQTGYYLGCEAIRRLERSLSLDDIALLPLSEIDVHMRLALEALAVT